MNETEKFLNETEPEDILEAPLEEQPEAKAEDEEVDDSLKNRRHRRLEAKLQAEKEANIALAARLDTITEAKKSQENPLDHLKSVERIYGTESPEAVAATEILKNALKNVEDRATERALETLRQEQRQAQAELKQEDANLDAMVEELEDDFGVDLTSAKAEPLRKGFFKMMEKLSPKDSEGNVTHYADAHAVWEEYQLRLNKKPENRAKDLSSRSMVKSGASDSKIQDNAELRFLRENGII